MNLADLKKPFPPERISWRVGSTTKDKSKGMALAYIDARDVQDRLDEVCGVDGWQCRYVPMHDKKTVCEIGVKVGWKIGNTLSPTTMQNVVEWIWKSDGAGDSDIEAEKGALSDAFKRAAVRWGVGRYLYDLESPWVALEPAGNSFKIAAHEYKRLEALLSKTPTPATDRMNAMVNNPAPTPSPTMSPVEWGEKAIIRIKEAKTPEELNAFTDRYHDKIAKLRLSIPETHAQVISEIQRKNAEFA